MQLISLILLLLAGAFQPTAGTAALDRTEGHDILHNVVGWASTEASSSSAIDQPIRDLFNGLMFVVESGSEEVESHDNDGDGKSHSSVSDLNTLGHLLQTSGQTLLRDRPAYHSDLPKFILFEVFRI